MTYRDCIFLSIGAAIGSIFAYVITKDSIEKKTWNAWKDENGKNKESEEASIEKEPVSSEIDFDRMREEHMENIKNTSNIIRSMGYSDNPEENIDTPYIISSHEVGDLGYTMSVINWWPAYSIATDEIDGGEINDIFALVGKENVLTIEHTDENVGYIRDDSLGVDYQINIMYGDCPVADSRDI